MYIYTYMCQYKQWPYRCLRKNTPQRRGRVGRHVFRARNQGLESSFCFRIEGQRLPQRESLSPDIVMLWRASCVSVFG